MAACGRLPNSVFKRTQFHQFISTCYYSSTSVNPISGSKQIVIPYRIERGPTDILKQLATTVHKDYTAPHYKYEDDPYFIPSSNVTKRAFALSKESGRKAARYFLEKYPDLFKCNKSEPHVKAFDPPFVYTEENVNCEDQLKQCIKDFLVDNSLLVYNILKSKGINIEQGTKQELLELLCFYNSNQPPPDDYFEERFFSRDPKEKWNNQGAANVIFDEMEKDNKSYSTMISGLAKYTNAEKAETLFYEMREKGFPGTVEVYNNMISIVNLLKEAYEMRWEYTMQLLWMMNVDGLKPDLYTMNAVMEQLSRNSKWRAAPSYALQVLAEMRRLKIVPSLGTYYHLLLAFVGPNTSRSIILYEIISELENKEFELLHPSDVSFFHSAMEVCSRGLRDRDLGYRIHNLLEYKNNAKFLGNAFGESLYFKHFFRLLCATEDIDKLMEVYEKYIPNTYTPEPSVILAVVESIHFSGNYQHLPKMCSDVLFFEQTERENILEVLLEAAGCMVHEKKIQSDLVQMVWNIFEKLNMRLQGGRSSFQWTGALLGNVLKTFMNGNDVEKSWSVIKKLKDSENTIIGYPEKSILLQYCQLCLENEEYDKFRFCVKYAMLGSCPDFRKDVEALATKTLENQDLSPSHRAAVESLFQGDTYKDEDDTSSSSSSGSDSSSSDEEEDTKGT